MATKTTIGYTYQETRDFGFFDWTEIAREEIKTEYGCQYYEDCPCCVCDEEVEVIVTYARPRWSKSGKRMVEETFKSYACVAHL